MKAEIITVGTELITGKTLDTHSAFISQKCAGLGIPIQFHSSIGDDQKNLLSLFALTTQRSDLVFVCGGLGPTRDDITKETLVDFLEGPMKPVNMQSNDVLQLQAKQNNHFTEATFFPNRHGTVSGLAVRGKNTTFILMPGPPQELIPMFEAYVVPFLNQINPSGEPLHHIELSFFGIGESKLEKKIKDLITANQEFSCATYIDETSVTLRLTGKRNALEKMAILKKEVLQRVGGYCFSDQGESLSESVVQLLHKHNKKVACVESCTGGLLSHLFSSVSGSSAVFLGGYVSYTNQVKEKLKLVDPSVLNEYGAIHARTAQSMAERTLHEMKSDYVLSVTGIAGPTAVEEKPVGRIYIGLAEKNQHTRIYQLSLKGSRKKNQQFAANHALFILQQRLRKGEETS